MKRFPACPPPATGSRRYPMALLAGLVVWTFLLPGSIRAACLSHGAMAPPGFTGRPADLRSGNADGPATDSCLWVETRRFGSLRVEKHVACHRLPETGPPSWPPEPQPVGCVARYRIWRESDNRLLLDVPGESCGRLPADSCRQIRFEDADFDGQPDLWVGTPGNDDFRFYGYRPWKDAFDTLFISCLNGLRRNPATQSATGFLLEYGQPPTHPLRRVDYVCCGPGLPVVHSMVTELPPPPVSDNTREKMEACSFVERKAGFRYELGPIRPEDRVEIPAEKGAYGQRVAIYDDSSGRLLHQHFLLGNTLREKAAPRTALLVDLIDFDTIPDVRIPGRGGRPDVLLLSCVQPDGRLVFYNHPELSRLENYRHDTATHTISGTYRLGPDRFHCRFTGVHSDTLHRIRQAASRPASAQLDIFRFLCGRQVLLSSRPAAPIMAPPIREFADFNFDGFPDLRVRPGDLAPDELDTPGTFFLFDSTRQAYLRHDGLSALHSVRFDPDRQLLTGQVTVHTDARHHSTTGYSMVAGQLLPTYRQDCSRPAAHAERIDCVVYLWQDGQWVWSHLLPGAE